MEKRSAFYEDLISTEFDDYSDYVTQAEEYYFKKKLPQ